MRTSVPSQTDVSDLGLLDPRRFLPLKRAGHEALIFAPIACARREWTARPADIQHAVLDAGLVRCGDSRLAAERVHTHRAQDAPCRCRQSRGCRAYCRRYPCLCGKNDRVEAHACGCERGFNTLARADDGFTSGFQRCNSPAWCLPAKSRYRRYFNASINMQIATIDEFFLDN